jgi:hypothetical protein
MLLNSGRGFQIGQSFPNGPDEDLPIYNDAEHLLSAGGINEPALTTGFPAAFCHPLLFHLGSNSAIPRRT